MESFNLVHVVRSYLPRDVSNRITLYLGGDRAQTQAGIDAAIPGLLSGFGRVASTTDGARNLSSAVDRADSGILSNLGSMLGGSFSTGGGRALQSVLGTAELSNLTAGVGRSSGLGGKNVTTLLGFLAPVVLGVLKDIKTTKGLDAGGLANLLAGQKSNIAAAMPEGMRAMQKPEHTPESPRDVSRGGHYETAAGSPRAVAHKPSASWILPALLALSVLGLIWYATSRPAVRAARDEGGVAERTERMRDMYGRGPASFESLKSRYRSVIQEANNQGVQISKLQERDGKLFIEGTAPSTEAANQVWNEIKRIDPNLDGIMANFRISSNGYR
jgi:hypothetical protein